MVELLAPAGSFNKLKTAIHFGADAVYVGGSEFSLRAYSNNFDYEGLSKATTYTHQLGKKIYVATNIFPRNNDFGPIKEYLQELDRTAVDGIIVSDLGVLKLASKHTIPIHISTQANTLNGYTAKVYEQLGAKRIVLARECSVDDISKIKEMVSIELETFVHGAMCISYSGRCLLSNYLSSRDSNRGECVQACRWEYVIREKDRQGELDIVEDDKGAYILNSKDLNMIEHLDKLKDAGVDSFKIEGRMKSQYYVANVVNAYRRAIDSGFYADSELINELYKNSHRGYTTGFYLGEYDRENHSSSQSKGEFDFVAEVIDVKDNGIVVEQRNRFKAGDALEILSSGKNHNKQIVIDTMYDKCNNVIEDAKFVQQELFIPTDIKLNRHDILRVRV